MSRSSFKGPFLNPNIKNTFKKSKSRNIIKIVSKNIMILPVYIDKTLLVYNGNRWVSRLITEDMVGYILGAFIFTRKVFKYKKKK